MSRSVWVFPGGNSKDMFSRDEAQVIQKEKVSCYNWKNLDTVNIPKVSTPKMSHVMRLWYFSSSVNSFFKRARAAITVWLDVWFFVGPFINFEFHTSCVRPAKALARLRRCAVSPEPSLVAYVISTIISWAGSNIVRFEQCGFTI